MTEPLDSLARRVAHECVCEHCHPAAVSEARRVIAVAVADELSKGHNPEVLFDAMYKSIAPYERQIRTMLHDVWEKQRKTIVANIRKYRKGMNWKDAVDQLLYPSGVYVKEVADEMTNIFIDLVEAEGTRTVAVYDFDMVFDVYNPNVTRWLNTYVPKFSKDLDKVSKKKLRDHLIEGIKAGEGIPELIKRVNTTYANWNRARSERIARSETIRASNAAAKEVYRQSGVVKKIVWITALDDRTCPWCEELDGKVVDIEENFFNLGDEFTITRDGERQTMTFDYTDIGYPPAHVSCRCALGPMIED